jgi:Ca2+-binding RTX toxin-like protein
MAIKNGSGGNNTINGTSLPDVLHGRGGNDVVSGRGSSDFLYGDGGNDRVFGNNGFDQLFGGAGRDFLDGGAGRDLLHGGAGPDTFYFEHARDTRPGVGNRDTILDFRREDTIDITNIDANKGIDDNQDFDFIGTRAFGNTAGELRYGFKTIAGVKHTILEGDNDGDGKADFQIDLIGRIKLTSDDILGG